MMHTFIGVAITGRFPLIASSVASRASARACDLLAADDCHARPFLRFGLRAAAGNGKTISSVFILSSSLPAPQCDAGIHLVFLRWRQCGLLISRIAASAFVWVVYSASAILLMLPIMRQGNAKSVGPLRFLPTLKNIGVAALGLPVSFSVSR